MDIGIILKARLKAKIRTEEARIEELKTQKRHIGIDFQETIYNARIDTYKVLIDEIEDLEHEKKE